MKREQGRLVALMGSADGLEAAPAGVLPVGQGNQGTHGPTIPACPRRTPVWASGMGGLSSFFKPRYGRALYPEEVEEMLADARVLYQSTWFRYDRTRLIVIVVLLQHFLLGLVMLAIGKPPSF